MPHYFSKKNLKKIFSEKIFPKMRGKGIDGIGVAAFEANLKNNISTIHHKIHSQKFHFTPYLEILLSKGRNKPPRMISIPTLRDKIVLQALHQYLRHKFPGSLPTRLPNTYIREIKQELFKAHPNYSCVLKYDISNFYPSINSRKLIKKIKKKVKYQTALKLVQSALSTPTIRRGTKKTEYPSIKIEGVAQGLSISNILSEIYMYDFDIKIQKLPIKYWRYVDDIIILCHLSNKDKVDKAMHKLTKDLDLDCDNDKFDTCTLENEFNYLGYKLSNKKISVQEKSFESHIQKIMDIFRWYEKSKNDNKIDQDILKNALIDSINERITGAISGEKRYGWLFYFSEISDKTLLYRIDAIINKKFINHPDFCGIPNNLKRSMRAYHEIIHSPHKGYIHNYDKYTTAKERMDFLISRCVIPRTRRRDYPAKEVHIKFYQYRNKQLSRLKRDIGVFS